MTDPGEPPASPDDPVCERTDEPIYELDGDVLDPTVRAAGPWFDGVQHGGAVAALVVRAVEQLPTAVPMDLARLTLDLSRKVGLGPTQVRARITRDGRRLQSVEVVVEVDGVEASRATALRIRHADGAVDPALVLSPWPDDASPGSPESAHPFVFDGDRFRYPACFEARSPAGNGPGRGVTWWRPRHPLVRGEVPSPGVRTAMVADMVMSAGSIVGFDRYTSANPDLTVALHRPVRGAWIAVSSVVRVAESGLGHGEGVLSDRDGRFGVAVKSLLVDRR